jgi:hypothetical protein
MCTTAFAGQLQRKFDLIQDSLFTSVVAARWGISGSQMTNTNPDRTQVIFPSL